MFWFLFDFYPLLTINRENSKKYKFPNFQNQKSDRFMKKNIFLLLVTLFAASCQDKPTANPEVQLIQKAQLIHLKTTTLDTHDDIAVKTFTDTLNYTMDTNTQVNLPKMESGALDVAWFIEIGRASCRERV